MELFRGMPPCCVSYPVNKMHVPQLNEIGMCLGTILRTMMCVHMLIEVTELNDIINLLANAKFQGLI